MLVNSKFEWTEHICDINQDFSGETTPQYIIPPRDINFDFDGKIVNCQVNLYRVHDRPTIKINVSKGEIMISCTFEYTSGQRKRRITTPNSISKRNRGINTTFFQNIDTGSPGSFNSMICTNFKFFARKKMNFSLSVEMKLKDTHAFKKKESMTLSEALFYDKDMRDVMIICNDKTFECHKAVLSCRSSIFRTMFNSESTNEVKTGKVNINDFEPETIETMISFLYFGKILNTEKITSDLLRIADKYDIRGLLEQITNYLQENLKVETALDIMVAAHQTNQKVLFDSSVKFLYWNKDHLGKVEKTMIQFLYQGKILDMEKIDSDLLRLAEKYNFVDLMELCTNHLKVNVNIENALDILVAAHQTNQKSLFVTAATFVYRNKARLGKADDWKEFKEKNPKLADIVIEAISNL